MTMTTIQVSRQYIDPIHPGGWPRKHSRLREAWWVLTGQWSLHRAWQAGKDRGGADEYQRIIINGGDTIPLIDSAIYATISHILNGQEPQIDLLRELRAKAWQRFKRDSALISAWGTMPAADGAASSQVNQPENILPATLPCDVHLPPNTYLQKGVAFTTLIAAFAARQKFPAKATTFPEPSPITPYADLCAWLQGRPELDEISSPTDIDRLVTALLRRFDIRRRATDADAPNKPSNTGSGNCPTT